VSVNRNRVTYTMVRGKPLTFDHFGKPLRLTPGRSVVKPIPRIATREEPKQPPGRAPARRGQEQPRELRPQRRDRRSPSKARARSA